MLELEGMLGYFRTTVCFFIRPQGLVCVFFIRPQGLVCFFKSVQRSRVFILSQAHSQFAYGGFGRMNYGIVLTRPGNAQSFALSVRNRCVFFFMFQNRCGFGGGWLVSSASLI